MRPGDLQEVFRRIFHRLGISRVLIRAGYKKAWKFKQKEPFIVAMEMTAQCERRMVLHFDQAVWGSCEIKPRRPLSMQ